MSIRHDLCKKNFSAMYVFNNPCSVKVFYYVTCRLIVKVKYE